MSYDTWKTTEPDPHAECASRCPECGTCECEPPCDCTMPMDVIHIGIVHSLQQTVHDWRGRKFIITTGRSHPIPRRVSRAPMDAFQGKFCRGWK